MYCVCPAVAGSGRTGALGIGRLCRPLCGLVARWFDFLNEFLPCGKMEFGNGHC